MKTNFVVPTFQVSLSSTRNFQGLISSVLKKPDWWKSIVLIQMSVILTKLDNYFYLFLVGDWVFPILIYSRCHRVIILNSSHWHYTWTEQHIHWKNIEKSNCNMQQKRQYMLEWGHWYRQKSNCLYIFSGSNIWAPYWQFWIFFGVFCTFYRKTILQGIQLITC